MENTKTVPNSMSDKIIKDGQLIGELSPSKSSKGSWGETYLYNDKYYHLAYSDTQSAWLVFILEFQKEDLSKYID